MNQGRSPESTIKCKLLWKLCRGHNWTKNGVAHEDLVNLALEDTEQGRGKELAEDLLDEPYVTSPEQDRYGVKNNPRAQAQAAFRLHESCGYTELQIEASLSRFQQAGGFDAFERDDVLTDLDEW